MWREIKLLAEAKPVVASMSDVAASGGYYMAMAANTIVAENLTLTGSIGVVTGDLIFVQLSLSPSPLLDCSCMLLLLQQDLPWQNYMKRLASTRKLYLEANMLSFSGLRKDLLSKSPHSIYHTCIRLLFFNQLMPIWFLLSYLILGTAL